MLNAELTSPLIVGHPLLIPREYSQKGNGMKGCCICKITLDKNRGKNQFKEGKFSCPPKKLLEMFLIIEIWKTLKPVQGNEGFSVRLEFLKLKII